MITIEYTCADGTPFPVTFPDEEQAAKTWRLDREHGAFLATPLMRAVHELGRAGTEAVYRELELPPPLTSGRGPDANGFSYGPENPLDAFDLERLTAGVTRLVAEHGGALQVWRDATMPRSQAAVAFLDQAPATIPFADAAYHHAYGMTMTMISAYVCFNDHQLLMATCAELYPDDAELVAYELTQGYDNPTLRADQALWNLGRLVLGSDALRHALATDDPATAMRILRGTAQEPAFFSALDAFLDEFGGRGEAWDIVCPTWREQQNGFWRQLAALATPDAPSPAEALAKAAQRRESLAADISARLADDPEKQARFQRRYERAACYVLVREERALWQLILAGSMRQVALRHANRLLDAGRLDAVDDIFFLRPEEIESDDIDLRPLVAERRAEHERWIGVTPPDTIGGEAAKPAAAPSLPEDRVLRGVAGSRGLATGPARIVTDLADADRVEPGDVLVCIMTAPPWTPLFGIASAVVTDSGSLSSHPAIASREYGVPCVLNTRTGTAVIPDGATVTVDGDAGTVTVHPLS